MPTGEQDTRRKIRLERQIQPRLRGYFRAMAREMRRVLIATGRVIDTRARGNEALTGILLAHYHKAADVFATGIRNELPSAVAITGEEAAEVDATLSNLFPDHAAAQAQRINDTSSRQMMWAVKKARRLEAEATTAGEPLGQRAVAQMATTFWLRRALGRVTTISMTETEWSAETSKLVEALVLVHQTEMLTLKQIPVISLIPLKVWWSQGDGRVRNHHLNADGQQRPATELFVVDGEKLMYPGDATHGASSSNLANCFPADVLVDTAEVLGAQRALYSGDLIQIEVAGSVLTITPHHPVATPSGFCPAGELREGDYVLTDKRLIEAPRPLPATVREGQEIQGIATIEDVFSSIRKAGGPAVNVVRRADHFHGDGADMESQVEIVWADGELWRTPDASGIQRVLHGGLEGPLPGSRLTRGRPTPGLGVSNETATGGIVRGLDLPIALAEAHLAPLEPFGLGSASDGDAVLTESPINDRARNPELLGQRIDASPFDVSACQILSVHRYPVPRPIHVYDLTTRSGLIAAAGIITSNCRCSAIYDVGTIADLRAVVIPGLVIPITPDLEVFPITESAVVVGFDL